MTTPLTKIPARHADLTGKLPEAALPESGNFAWDTTAKRQAVTGTIAGRATGTTINLTATITNVALTANVATFTTSATHGFRVYDLVVVSGLATSDLNGSFIVSGVPSATTFTCRYDHADIASTPDTGTAVVSTKQDIQEYADANGRRALYMNGNGGIVIQNDLAGPPARYADNASITIVQTQNGVLGDDAAFVVKDANFAWVETATSPGLSYQFEILADGSLLTGRHITSSQDRSKPSGRICTIGGDPYMIGASADVNGPCFIAQNQLNIPGEKHRYCIIFVDAADPNPNYPAGGVWGDRGVGKEVAMIGPRGEQIFGDWLNPAGSASDPEALRLAKAWFNTTTKHYTIEGSGQSGTTSYLDVYGPPNGNAVLRLGSRGNQNAMFIGSAASSTGIGQLGLGGVSFINFYNNPIGVAGVAVAIGVDDASSVLTVDAAPSNIGVRVLTVRGKSGQLGDLFRAQDFQQNNLWRVNKGGFAITAKNSAIADADLNAGECTDWWDSTNGASRKRFKGKSADGTVISGAFAPVLSVTATLDFGSTAAQSSTDLTISVTGAVVGDSVSIGVPAAPAANTGFFGWVSAADTVTVRHCNFSSGAVDPTSGTYRVTVTRL